MSLPGVPTCLEPLLLHLFLWHLKVFFDSVVSHKNWYLQQCEFTSVETRPVSYNFVIFFSLTYFNICQLFSSSCRTHHFTFPCYFLLRNFGSLSVYNRLARNGIVGCRPKDPLWTMGMCCISSWKFFTASTHVCIIFDILSLLDIFVTESNNRHCARFFSEYFGFALSLSFLRCSILTLIYLPLTLCNLSNLRHWKHFSHVLCGH